MLMNCYVKMMEEMNDDWIDLCSLLVVVVVVAMVETNDEMMNDENGCCYCYDDSNDCVNVTVTVNDCVNVNVNVLMTNEKESPLINRIDLTSLPRLLLLLAPCFVDRLFELLVRVALELLLLLGVNGGVFNPLGRSRLELLELFDEYRCESF